MKEELQRIKGLPTEIWLQIDDDDETSTNFSELDKEFVTWCDSKINVRDAKYLRAEKIEAAFQKMMLNEDSGGTGWWSGWAALKDAMGVKAV